MTATATQPASRPAAPRIDLHTHTNTSDGLLSPAELAAEAGRRGLSVLALTDHDTLDGLAPCGAACAPLGVEFIPGVELSTDVGPFEVHILGYFVDPADPTLTGALADLARQRVGRVERIVARLAEIGRPVEFERVRAIAGAGTIGRPHIARAMVERGYVASVADAFDRYLASGRPGFVPRTPNSPEGAVRLLRAAHAVPVLAHPLTAGDIAGILTRLVPAGLLGMECYYGEYDDATCAELRRIADRWGLIPTGGSDYHGPNFKEGRDLGSVAVPADCVDRLRVASRIA